MRIPWLNTGLHADLVRNEGAKQSPCAPKCSFLRTVIFIYTCGSTNNAPVELSLVESLRRLVEGMLCISGSTVRAYTAVSHQVIFSRTRSSLANKNKNNNNN